MGEFKQTEMSMRQPFDMYRLVERFHHLKGAWKPWDVARLSLAIDSLRKTPLPQAYVDGLQDELFQMVGQAVPPDAKVKVYLAFFGDEGRASFLKIGVAKNVKNRLSAYVTGTPMPNIATYEAAVGGRSRAMNVEGALLRHMEADKAKGEWVKVAGLSPDAIKIVVQSLAEVATAANGRDVTFAQAG